MNQTIGLYLHIPFCRSKCAYCDFYSVPNAPDALRDAYMRALSAHLRETASSGVRYTVDTVYIGGGTPSLLGHKALHTLMGTLRKHYRLTAQPEITLEANPGTVDADFLRRARSYGVNRLSLGAQSFNDDALRTLGRVHTADQIGQAVQAARDAGFRNISLDLIYGLPSQSAKDWEQTLAAALALAPEHISCYGLKVEEGTPFWERRAALAVPDDDAQASLYLSAVSLLSKAGYEQYEISNFSKKSFACRHNLKYWTLAPYLGLGAAAHSDFGDRRWSYVRDAQRYIDGVSSGESILDDFEQIPPQERASEYLMLRLRTTEGISGNEYTRLFRADFTPIERTLESLVTPGYAQRAGTRWRLTPKGFLVSNRIILDVLAARTGEGVGGRGSRG